MITLASEREGGRLEAMEGCSAEGGMERRPVLIAAAAQNAIQQWRPPRRPPHLFGLIIVKLLALQIRYRLRISLRCAISWRKFYFLKNPQQHRRRTAYSKRSQSWSFKSGHAQTSSSLTSQFAFPTMPSNYGFSGHGRIFRR